MSPLASPSFLCPPYLVFTISELRILPLMPALTEHVHGTFALPKIDHQDLVHFSRKTAHQLGARATSCKGLDGCIRYTRTRQRCLS